jgi:hypothetical protein
MPARSTGELETVVALESQLTAERLARETAERAREELRDTAENLLRTWATNPVDSPRVYEAIKRLRNAVRPPEGQPTPNSVSVSSSRGVPEGHP